jgi:hypothetical protein
MPHPVESVWVKQVFAWYLTTEYSDGKIAEALNAATHLRLDGTELAVRHKGMVGRPPPGKFSKEMVRGMLTRIFYTGQIPYYSLTPQGKSRKRQGPQAVYPGLHPALIEETAFARVQELRGLANTSLRVKGATRYRLYPLTVSFQKTGGNFRSLC